MIVTPEGSIIDMVNGNAGRCRKPETDPDWEERKAKWDSEGETECPGPKRARKRV